MLARGGWKGAAAGRQAGAREAAKGGPRAAVPLGPVEVKEPRVQTSPDGTTPGQGGPPEEAYLHASRFGPGG